MKLLGVRILIFFLNSILIEPKRCLIDCHRSTNILLDSNYCSHPNFWRMLGNPEYLPLHCVEFTLVIDCFVSIYCTLLNFFSNFRLFYAFELAFYATSMVIEISQEHLTVPFFGHLCGKPLSSPKFGLF